MSDSTPGYLASYRDGLRRLITDLTTDNKPAVGDLFAGLSVALVLIPQSMAYADIAGLPPYVGLFAAAFPLLVFALFAASPYLQTGPVAVTSLLTIGVLSTNGTDIATDVLVKQAALLAIIVGVVRFMLGVLRLGVVAYLLAEPVMIGFTSGAGVVILSSQLPKVLGVAEGVSPGYANPILETGWALLNPGEWDLEPMLIGLVTIVLMLGGRKMHKLFPGVLVAVILGVIYSQLNDYDGKIVGTIPEGWPPFSLDLPWGDLPSLLIGGIVIALVGFAEPASIARTFAGEDGTSWSGSQEFLSSGLANLTAGLTSAFPVGGSFSRSSVNRFSGAQTKWSGGVTGLVVLAFLPFASILEPLPEAVLGAIVIGAVQSLVKPQRLLRLWGRSKTQATLTYLTFALTLVTPPKVYWAVILGVVLALAHHLFLKFRIEVDDSDPGVLRIKPVGMLWFASTPELTDQLRAAGASHVQTPNLELDLSDIPSIDAGIADAIEASFDPANPFDLTVVNYPAGSEALLKGVGATLG